MEIEVTQNHIDFQRNPSDSQSCAIYSAVKEQWPKAVVHVLIDKIMVDEFAFECLPCVYGWQMGNIHNSTRVAPITLLFDMKEKYVRVESPNLL